MAEERLEGQRRRQPSADELARKAARTEELLDAADRAIRRDGPNVSMDAIAAEAGTAKPVLYRYFGDKGGLYQALAGRYVEDVITTVQEAVDAKELPPERLAAGIDAYLRMVEESPEVYRFLMHRMVSERSEALVTVSDFVRRLGDQFGHNMIKTLERYGLDTEGALPWGHGIVGIVQVAGDWWFENRTMSRERLVHHLVTLLWKGFSGLAPPPPEEP